MYSNVASFVFANLEALYDIEFYSRYQESVLFWYHYLSYLTAEVNPFNADP